MGTPNSPTFEEWLRDVSFNPASSPEEQGAVSDAWRRWLRQFFDERGPVAPGLVAEAVAEYQLALANEAIAAVLADMHRVGAHAVARIGELERSGTAP